MANKRYPKRPWPYRCFFPWLLWRGFRLVERKDLNPDATGHGGTIFGQTPVVQLRVSGQAMYQASRKHRTPPDREYLRTLSWGSAAGAWRDPWHQLLPIDQRELERKRVKLRTSQTWKDISEAGFDTAPHGLSCTTWWVSVRNLPVTFWEEVCNTDWGLTAPTALFSSRQFANWLLILHARDKEWRADFWTLLNEVYGLASPHSGSEAKLDQFLRLWDDWHFGILPMQLTPFARQLFWPDKSWWPPEIETMPVHPNIGWYFTLLY